MLLTSENIGNFKYVRAYFRITIDGHRSPGSLSYIVDNAVWPIVSNQDVIDFDNAILGLAENEYGGSDFDGSIGERIERPFWLIGSWLDNTAEKGIYTVK